MDQWSLNKIESWAILYSEDISIQFNALYEQLKQTVTKDFKYPCNKPLPVQINGDNESSKTWIDEIVSLNGEYDLDIIICIVPGVKN